ncbi:hypothetical protein CEXT_512071 [Caerostris extrusa]|uniref:Uncharacterized protein n=1 Tax=Caerostris extrusa TaxID=172846 RepID=A0AAV4XBM4_CAEEX|nr:hypothetical protein CEXT_512071 [Caerostris extrusa]
MVWRERECATDIFPGQYSDNEREATSESAGVKVRGPFVKQVAKPTREIIFDCFIDEANSFGIPVVVESPLRLCLWSGLTSGRDACCFLHCFGSDFFLFFLTLRDFFAPSHVRCLNIVGLGFMTYLRAGARDAIVQHGNCKGLSGESTPEDGVALWYAVVSEPAARERAAANRITNNLFSVLARVADAQPRGE